MLRVAVVGAGNHSERNHGPSLRDLAVEGSIDIELAAVCDLDLAKAEAYSSKFGFGKSYDSIRSMLDNERLDAIVSVTPLSATRAIVGELLAHRIPILLEKPPGRNLSETEELIEIAADYGTPNMVSFNRRFVPAMRIATTWLNRLGSDRKPYLLIARMLRHERLESGFIMGTAIHLVDTILSVFNNPLKISTYRTGGNTNGSRCEGRIEYADNRSAILAVEPASGVNEESYEIIGTGYRVLVEIERNTVTIHDMGDRIVYAVPAEDTPPYRMSGCYNETEAFIRAVDGIGEYSPTLADTFDSMATAAALSRGKVGPL